jgi:hypothetical protein
MPGDEIRSRLRLLAGPTRRSARSAGTFGEIRRVAPCHRLWCLQAARSGGAGFGGSSFAVASRQHGQRFAGGLRAHPRADGRRQSRFEDESPVLIVCRGRCCSWSTPKDVHCSLKSSASQRFTESASRAAGLPTGVTDAKGALKEWVSTRSTRSGRVAVPGCLRSVADKAVHWCLVSGMSRRGPSAGVQGPCPVYRRLPNAGARTARTCVARRDGTEAPFDDQ